MSGLKRPTFILREPLIAEVFGGGFTKEANAKVEAIFIVILRVLTYQLVLPSSFPSYYKSLSLL